MGLIVQGRKTSRSGLAKRGGPPTVVVVALVAVAVAFVICFLVVLAQRDVQVRTVETTVTAGPVTTTTAPAPTRLVIGTSVQGREIELYAFGSGEWRVLVIGGVHGDEYGGRVVKAFLEYLEQLPEAVPDGASIQLVPSVNPDGEAAGTRGNANAVDVNRNFPSQDWRSELNAGDRPTTGLTGGSSPGSEPETRALLSVLEDGWDLVISLHSSGGIVDPDGEGGMAIAQRMSELSGLPLGGLNYQAQITGSLGVFVPERYQVPVITLELKSASLTEGIKDALLAALVPRT
jgi:protein MpaA